MVTIKPKLYQIEKEPAPQSTEGNGVKPLSASTPFPNIPSFVVNVTAFAPCIVGIILIAALKSFRINSCSLKDNVVVKKSATLLALLILLIAKYKIGISIIPAAVKAIMFF